MKKIFSLAAFAALVFLGSSCQRELDPIRDLKTNEIGFLLAGTKVSTKASAEAAPVTLSMVESKDIELCITETVTSMDDLYAPQASTKATPAYTMNVAELYGSFSSVGYKDGSAYLPKADYVHGADNLWKHEYTEIPTIDWSGNGVYFFMTMPETPIKEYNESAGSMTFDYTSPAKAVDQKDILFATKRVKNKTTDNEVVFYHALTAVKFATGNLDGKVTIDTVAFYNIKTSGTCVMTPSAGTTACATWTLDETRGTVSQDFDGTIVNFTKENSNFLGSATDDTSDTFYQAATENNINDDKASKTFFLIPQSTEGIYMIVSYTVNGTKYISAIDMYEATNHAEWKAGELRTYTLTENDLTVDIADEIVNGTKQNVVITNTSNISEYVRAMVVANWFDANGDIVAPCLDITGMTVKQGWVRGKDGFYYFNAPVAKGAKLEKPFFDTYTPSAGPAGAHLVMDIAVQAIDANAGSTYTEAWQKTAGVEF